MLEVRSVKGFGCWPVFDLYSRGEGRRPKAFTKSVAHLKSEKWELVALKSRPATRTATAGNR
jgi:hypothetical protein